ncbi:MAG: RNA-binding S4 domain-containing protein [Desulfopila sp.]
MIRLFARLFRAVLVDGGLQMADGEETLRIDKWLWAARFFKTRSLANRAVNGGKVHLNGARIKSSRGVRVGDRMVITKNQMEYAITILGISQYRRPASEAVLLYQESQESMEKRLANAEQRKLIRAAQPAPEKKPGKRDRRKI